MNHDASGFPFAVDPESTFPPWMQLRKRIAFLIESGYFKPGDQLPKIRDLAAEISINFNTVNKAYLSLQSDGLLKSIRGRGVFVSDPLPGQAGSFERELEAVFDDCLRSCRNLGLTYEEAAERMLRRAKVLTIAESIPYRVPSSNVIVLTAGDRVSAKEA